MTAFAEAAVKFVARGWAPVAVGFGKKRPIEEGWQTIRMDEKAARRAFNGSARNVGVIMGVSGLTDVDLDAGEAMAVASFFLPRTSCIFGRPSARASHWLYRTELAASHPSAEISFADPVAADAQRAKLVEIRIGGGGRGAQTIVPPSQHPSGEAIAWEIDGKEAEVDGAELVNAVMNLAACALAARHWPNEGNRHHAASAWGGFLARCGWTPPRVRLFLQAVCAVHPGSEDDWPRTAENAALAHEQGRNAYGYPEIEKLHGPRVAKCLAEWLRFDPGKNPKPDKATETGTKRPVSSPLEIDRSLARDPELADIASYDEFASTLICNRPILHPDRAPQGAFLPRPWRDEDDTAMVEALNARGFPRVARSIAHEVVDLRARQIAAFHPVRSYLNGLRWDLRDRLSRWLIDYAGAVVETADELVYVEAISRCTLIAAVARIMSPGAKVDTMAILEGGQGAMKSSMLRILAVNDAWFSDSLPHDISTKDARQHLAGRWFVEMPEIAQFRRSEIETLKAFLSCQIDIYRPAYGRNPVHVARQCTIWGSTNETNYLRDATGNRRFWPVKVVNVDLDAIRANRDQLWAEAVAAWASEERWWLDARTQAIAAEVQAERLEADPWLDIVAVHVHGRAKITIPDILRSLDIEEARWGRAEETRIGKILHQLGWESKREPSGQRRRFYQPRTE